MEANMIDIDKLLEDIEFDNEGQKEIVRNAVVQELQKILDAPQSTIDSLEKLLLSAFRQIMPFFHSILDFHSLEYFADLNDSFDYIENCQQKNVSRPFPNLDHYIELCNLTSYTFDSSYLDDCPEELHEQMEYFCKAFYTEIQQKDHNTQIIAQFYEWPIFERYFYFLQYFNDSNFGTDYNKDRRYIVNCCKDWIPDILFEILWDMDACFNHTVNKSYVKEALKNIF